MHLNNLNAPGRVVTQVQLTMTMVMVMMSVGRVTAVEGAHYFCVPYKHFYCVARICSQINDNVFSICNASVYLHCIMYLFFFFLWVPVCWAFRATVEQSSSYQLPARCKRKQDGAGNCKVIVKKESRTKNYSWRQNWFGSQSSVDCKDVWRLWNEHRRRRQGATVGRWAGGQIAMEEAPAELRGCAGCRG